MTEKEIKSMLWKLLDDCERIHDECNEAWVNDEMPSDIYEYYDMEIGYIAYRISEMLDEKED